jgi:hypothetical protein
VRSPERKQFLEEYLELLLADNTRAWRQDAEGMYTRLRPDGAEPIDVQAWYLTHPIEFEKSVQPRTKLKDRVRRAVDAIKLPNREAIKLPNFKLPNRERKR